MGQRAAGARHACLAMSGLPKATRSLHQVRVVSKAFSARA